MEPSDLRQKYPLFEYVSSSWQLDQNRGLTLHWTFKIGQEHHFAPWLHIPEISQRQIDQIGYDTLDWYTFHIGIVEMLSYWKTTTSPIIKISAGTLTQPEIEWWHNLLKQGLGEFFYQNQIDFTAPDFVTWQTTGRRWQPTAASYSPIPHSVLLPLGGGKDSAVSLKILQNAQQKHQVSQLHTLVINPVQSALDTAAFSQLPLLRVERQLDPHLFEMNQQGYLNGHTPFSAMAAWVVTLVAHLFGYESVAVSNERSSNEGNVRWLGQEINHQYSKTLAFEKSFQMYLANHLEAPFYFSFLRPLYELQIGKLFSMLTESDKGLRSLFRSCNRGQKTNSWCGECSKCLFAFLMLQPFISIDEMISIFGKNILDTTQLYPTLLELVGKTSVKPFECVGTREESLVAAHLCVHKYHLDGRPLPSLLTRLEADVLSTEPHLDQRVKTILHSWTDEHSIPDHYLSLLTNHHHAQ